MFIETSAKAGHNVQYTLIIRTVQRANIRPIGQNVI